MQSLRMPAWLSEKRQFQMADDFTWYVTAHNWTTVATDSGTITVGDAQGGIVALAPSDGTVANNDETYIKSTAEAFKIVSGCEIYGEARLQFTEGNTDDANIFFGFADAIGANTLVDDGAGLKTSFSGAAIYKVDGGTVWKCVSSVSTAQTISTSTTTAGGSSYQKLRIEIRDVDGTNAEVTFFCDDLPLRDSNNKAIKHLFAWSGATEMQVGAGIKNGADTTVELLNIDYIFAAQQPRQ